MTNEQPGVRLNYGAIAVAAIASCAAQGTWYRIFLTPWLDGIGRTREWWMSPAAKNPLLQNGTAIIASVVIATAISCVTQVTGVQTALRGVKVAVLLWLGFVMTIWSIEYAFEVRPLSLLGINAGFWLVGMGIMGAVVGAWKSRKAVE